MGTTLKMPTVKLRLGSKNLMEKVVPTLAIIFLVVMIKTLLVNMTISNQPIRKRADAGLSSMPISRAGQTRVEGDRLKKTGIVRTIGSSAEFSGLL